jgi:uncharacterized membrane protein
MKKSISFIIINIFLICLLFGFTNIISAADGYIDITEPSYSNEYYEEDTINIRWTSSNAGNNVKIELRRGSAYSYIIASNTSNDGYYSFYISGGFASSSTYTIRVTSLEDENIYDDSSSFYIKDSTITVTQPTSNDVWYPGDYNLITWNSNNAGNYVKIQYSYGSYLYTIDSFIKNTGSYNWYIPSQLSAGDYQIKITSTSDSSIYDYSQTFTIGSRSIELSKPTEGETLYRGETYQIMWSSVNAGNNVKIEYKQGNFGYYRIIEYSTPNDGTYEWEIPDSLADGNNYFIRIKSTTYSAVEDVSDAFSIDRRFIEVYQPEFTDIWLPNETKSINWNSDNAGTRFDISLYKNGVYCELIYENIPDDGLQTWKVPSIYASDNDYQIEVRSRQYPTVFGLSDYFTIGARKITITSITNDERWNKGSEVQITWDAENAGDSVNIELIKEGNSIKSIVNNVDSSIGIYFWEIPTDIPTGEYQIKMSSNSYSDVTALSAGTIVLQETFAQQIFGPISFVIIFCILLVLFVIIIYKFRKKNISKNNKEKKAKTLINQPTQFSATNISSEEYENIWEKKDFR